MTKLSIVVLPFGSINLVFLSPLATKTLILEGVRFLTVRVFIVAPKDKYEEHHQTAIDKHMADGYSHREAERLAGAHDIISGDPYKSKIKPTQPSDKMLSHMKGLSGDWLRDAERAIGNES